MDSLSLTENRRQINWNNAYRIFLCCLFRFFRRDHNAFSEVFRSLFGLNFTNKELCTRLSTQWWDMRRKGDPIWHQVHVQIPFPPPEGPWLQMVSTIKETANVIGVSLVEKNVDDINVSGFHLNTRQVLRPAPLQILPLQTPVDTPTSNRTAFVDVDTPSSQVPGKQSSLSSPSTTFSSEPEGLCEAGGKICFWCCHEGADEVQTAPETSTDIPPILYRWANVDSQGVNTKSLIISGLFSHSDQDFFAPDEIPREEFEQYATKHVSIEKSLSPFISTFQSLLAPVHRAIRAGEGAAVTFIDTSKLETKVYSAKSLVWDLGIKIKGYRGLGEYLVWGKVPTPAIICTFKISTLVNIAEEDAGIGEILQLNRIKSSKRNRNELQTALSKGPGRVDSTSGLVVGRLLRKLNVPDPYLEAVAVKISHSWCFTRCKDTSDYLNGVQAGYHGQGPSPSPSPVLEQPLLETPPSSLPSQQQEESLVVSEDQDLHSLASDNEDEGKENVIPSIEFGTPCPRPRIQPFATETPIIEFFDPSNQMWSDNVAEMLSVYPFEDSFVVDQTSIQSNTLEPSEEAEEAVNMRDADLDVFMEDMVDFTQCTPYFLMDQ